MKMNLSFLILVFLISFSAVSQSARYQWDWAQEADFSNYQVVNDLAVDTSRGWVYTVGGFEDNLSANYGGETSSGGRDGFVSKFDTIGNLLWSFSIGGNEDDEILAIDVDKSDGDIYIVGYGGNSTFSFVGANGGTALGDNVAKGGKDVILAKYNSNGELIWYFRDGGNGDDYGRDIKVDLTQNKIAYTGDFHSRMELHSVTIDMGPNDNKRHMFLGCRRKSDGNGIWRAYSENGESEKGVALAYDDNYFYLVGDYEGDFNIVTEDGINFSNVDYSTSINRGGGLGVNIFYGRFKKNDGSMDVPLQGDSWLYAVYGAFSDYAGDIQIRGSKLYIGGSVSNNVVYNDGGNDVGVIGNEAFVSIHDIGDGSNLSRIREPNISATSKSIVNSISFTEDYLVAGGSTSGTIQFGGNSSNNLVANGSRDGFVSFYDLGTNAFVEVHEVDGSGDNQVLALDGRGKDVFVCGRFGFTAGLDADIQMTGGDDETGFVSLISHRLCKPRIEYASSSICSESPAIFPSLIEDTLDSFYQLGTGLTLNSVTGEINPFTSLAGNYKIVHKTYSGCADTVDLEIVGGMEPAFTTVPTNVTIYSTSSDCEASHSYTLPDYAMDCGVNIRTQIDGSGYTNGSSFPVGATEQVFVISDGYNDNDTCRFTVTVIDTISPEITCPQDDTIYTTIGECGAVVNLTALASDICGIDSIYQSGSNLTYLMGESFPVRETPYEIEFTAVDLNSQISTCSLNVLVKDTISPVIVNCPSSDIVAYAEASNCLLAVDYGDLQGTDACGGITESLIGLSTNSNFPIDTTAINYTVSDDFSNTSTCQFNVIVLDTISPEFACSPDTLRYYGTSCSEDVVFSPPSATDNCLFRVEQTSGITSGTNQGLGLNYNLDFKAIDSSGNFSTCRIRYEVIDSIQPVFVNCPSDTVLFADIQLCGGMFTFDSIGANDNCSLYFPTGSNYAMQTDLSGLSSGDTFPVGTTVLTFIQQDSSGNTSTCSFTVQVDNVESSSFNNNIPNGICVDADSIELFNTINGNNTGSFYVNGLLSQSNYYTPSPSSTRDTIMYIIGDNGCQDTIKHFISAHDFNAEAGVDSVSLCGLEVDLKAITEQGASHSWSYSSSLDFLPNDTVDSPKVVANIEGGYWLFWNVEIDECVKKDSVYVHFYEEPSSYAGANMTVDEDEVYLDADPVSGSGIWTTDNSEGIIEDSSSYNTRVSNLNLGLNTFQWNVSNGPCAIDSSVVRVFYNLLTIPNAFTPNGDGVNDYFEIKGFNLYSDAEITIIDRWGEQLFLSDDLTPFWDGKYQNKEVVEDTYFYILFINGLEYTGYIELRR